MVVLSILLFSTYTLLAGRRPSSMTQFETSIEKYTNSNLNIVDGNTLKKLISKANEVKSRSIILKIIEYSDVINYVSDQKWLGLGMGATYANHGLNNTSHYVHSQPFWLYFKGGLLLVIFFIPLFFF